MNHEKFAKEKRWIIKAAPETPEKKAAVNLISTKLGIDPIVAELLYTRGYRTAEEARRFLRMESEMLCDPFLLKDVSPAIDRIRRAVEKKEKIVVYGDYDVDGVTSVAVLVLYLRSLGADVDYYIPNRLGEGYGVSVATIDKLREKGVDLIVTVDTGTTANEEVRYAAQYGIDFVVTDHHECLSELPEAVALVNPHRPDCPYPFKELAGVGVIFKVICAYEEKYRGRTKQEATAAIFSTYADLVAIGTIADVMPICEENRIIVSYGLSLIERSPRMAISALVDASSARQDGSHADKNRKKQKITSSYIGYTLAPRINAAGRIRTASIAVELFLTDDYDRAFAIAEDLCLANKERQTEENAIMQEAAKKMATFDIERDPVIVLDADDWHHGVIGIVSSRITERFCRPSILISFEGNEGNGGAPSPDDVGKGSGRSVRGMNLVDALCSCGDHLVKFGGHELAAGLSVKRSELPAFIAAINDYARNNLRKEDMVPTVEADAEVSFGNLTLDLAHSLRILEPYGTGNPTPLFVMRGSTVTEVSGISNNKHTRLYLSDGKNSVCAMFFSASPESLGVSVGDTVDTLFQIDVNEWMGRKSLQLILKDLKIVMTESQRAENGKKRFEEIRSGAPFSRSENALPERRDFENLYRFLLTSYRDGQTVFPVRTLMSRLSDEQNTYSYVKIRLMLLVFLELDVIGMEEIEEDCFRFSLRYHSAKTSLEKSGLLRRLRSQQTE